MFQNKVIVVTGGAGGIGKCIAEEFRKQRATVCVIDCVEGPHFVGDLADKAVLEEFAQSVIDNYGRVDVLVNNAPPLFLGIDECSYEVILILAVYHLAVDLDLDCCKQGCATLKLRRIHAPVRSIRLQVHVHGKRYKDCIVAAHIDCKLTLAGRSRSIHGEGNLLTAQCRQ